MKSLSVVEKYAIVKEKRIGNILKFLNGQRPFLVQVDGSCTYTSNCNSVEKCCESNLLDFNYALDLPSDTLPYLEPWFGTGIYAQAFGSTYYWREGESPACHYAYRTIDQVRNVQKPDVTENKLFNMVLKAIEFYKNRTDDRLPICLTDTQSAHDTATLILDPTEVFIASYTEPEVLANLLKIINDVIVEFSRIQIKAIGDNYVMPGHIMALTNDIFTSGISISDDNLAVGSPQVNEKFMLPYDECLGEVFGGLAIHSCGDFGHTMPLIAKMKTIKMVDCTISDEVDTNPNRPETVRDCFDKTGIFLQVRLGSNLEKNIQLIRRLWAPYLKLIIRITSVEKMNAKKHYDTISSLLQNLYEC